MTTKELEEILGLTKHTIRYYEKEGFISPARNENGYRDYSQEDLQILLTVKFLRNLNISIDDVKGILDGHIDFNECLKINSANLDKQIRSLEEVKEVIDIYVSKDLPMIPALKEIKVKTKNYKLGFQKTTKDISLGRKLTKKKVIKKL